MYAGRVMERHTGLSSNVTTNLSLQMLPVAAVASTSTIPISPLPHVTVHRSCPADNVYVPPVTVQRYWVILFPIAS